MDPVNAYFHKIKTNDFEAIIFEAPSDSSLSNLCKDDYYNIAMIDVSGSMNTWWSPLLCHWNEKISPNLLGNSSVYVFGSEVKLCRDESYLCDSDFTRSSTNLSDAIKEIHKQIWKTQSKNIRVLLVTDGAHNATMVQPEKEIEKLDIPPGKTVEVFLVAIGYSFPVEYSLSIRSKLHNGNSNMPSLFWAKTTDDLPSQLASIKDILITGSSKFKISVPGCLAPGFDKINEVHRGEFLYFDENLDELSQLKLFLEDSSDFQMKVHTKQLSLELFLNKVVRQWSSLLIQQHGKKLTVPPSIFSTIDCIYKHVKSSLDTNTSGNILERLEKKNIKTLELDYMTLMNQSKAIIGIDGHYQSELELAEGILKTTVQSKYDFKNLKMKGYGDEDYKKDTEVFLNIYRGIKDSIMALPEPIPDDRCTITFGSTVKELQDENLHLLFEQDKFSLMKSICITGIPIFAPVKDSSQINAWTLRIKSVLVSPFSTVSQTVLEKSADVTPVTEENKGIFLQAGNESSHFNATVPVFDADVVKVLKPLLLTNTFAMLCTYCILKNPHIIDMNVHLAALSVVWIKTIKDYPKSTRPEFAKSRIARLEATASIYFDRKGISKYVEKLISETKEALMTESKKIFGKSTIKCESLTKPCVLLYLKRHLISTYEEKKHLVHLIVAEYVGRCLSKFQVENGSGIYSSFFAKDLYEVEDRAKWFQHQVQNKIDKYRQSKEMLIQFFTLEDLMKDVHEYSRKSTENEPMEIKLDMKKVNKLYNPSSAGDIDLHSLRAFAEEMDLLHNDIEEIFSINQMLIYVAHGLQHRTSRDRMSIEIVNYENALVFIKKQVSSENEEEMKKSLDEKMKEALIEEFKKEHEKVHRSLVKPLPKDAIIEKAKAKGVEVTKETFATVFKYNTKSGLLRNACMIEKCPHFLKPNRSFNQHLAIEREREYPHELHLVALNISKEGGNAKRVIEELMSGNYGGHNKRGKPTPPSLAYITSFTDEIEQLLQDYQEFESINLNK